MFDIGAAEGQLRLPFDPPETRARTEFVGGGLASLSLRGAAPVPFPSSGSRSTDASRPIGATIFTSPDKPEQRADTPECRTRLSALLRPRVAFKDGSSSSSDVDTGADRRDHWRGVSGGLRPPSSSVGFASSATAGGHVPRPRVVPVTSPQRMKKEDGRFRHGKLGSLPQTGTLLTVQKTPGTCGRRGFRAPFW